jgi:agmatinase
MIETFNNIDYSKTGKVGRKKSDVVILGVPFDLGSSNHAGQRNAPQDIRRAGYWPTGMLHLQHTVDPQATLAVVDAGDVDFASGDPMGAWKAMTATAKLLSDNSRCLISIGGDQSCTGKLVSGVALSDGHPLTVFHFDAHTDYDKPEQGVESDHSSWVRHVIEGGAVNRVVQFGVRGWGTPELDRLWASKNDVATYYAQEHGWLARLNDEVKDTSDNIYLSIDVHALDPAFAPGVAYREPGGLTTRELFAAVQMIASSGKMVAADVMEVIPDRDPTGVTVKVGSRLVMQLLTGLAMRQE